MSVEISIELFASSVAPGMVESEIQVYSGSDLTTLVTSAQFNFKCRRGILNGDTLAATREYPLLTALIKETQAMQARLEAMLSQNEAIAAAEKERASAEAIRKQAEKQRAIAILQRYPQQTAMKVYLRVLEKTSSFMVKKQLIDLLGNTLPVRFSDIDEPESVHDPVMPEEELQVLVLFRIGHAIKGVGCGPGNVIGGTGGQMAENQLFCCPAAEQHRDFVLQFFLGHQEAVFGRPLQGVAQSADAPGND